MGHVVLVVSDDPGAARELFASAAQTALNVVVMPAHGVYTGACEALRPMIALVDARTLGGPLTDIVGVLRQVCTQPVVVLLCPEHGTGEQTEACAAAGATVMVSQRPWTITVTQWREWAQTWECAAYRRRRNAHERNATEAAAAPQRERVAIGARTVDLRTGEVERASEGGTVAPARLPGRACAVLRVLLRHPGELMSRDMLARECGDDFLSGDERQWGVIVTTLRHFLEDDPYRPRHFRTVWGKGYRFSP